MLELGYLTENIGYSNIYKHKFPKYMMNKNWYDSKTSWGAVLLAVEAGLLTLPGMWVWPEAVLAGLGTFLVIFGFRDAMK